MEFVEEKEQDQQQGCLLSKVYTSADFHSRNEYVFQLAAQTITEGTSSGKVAASTSSGIIKLYQTTSTDLTYYGSLQGHSARISDISIVSSGVGAGFDSHSYLLSACEDGVIRMFDFSGNNTKPLASYESGISDNRELFSCSSNGNLIAAGGHSQVLLFDIRVGSRILNVYDDFAEDIDVLKVAFHPHNESQLFSGSEDGLIVQYDTTISNNDDSVLSVFGPQGQSIGKMGFFGSNLEFIYCLDQIEQMSLWDINEAAQIGTFNRCRESFASVDYLISCYYEQQSQQLFLFTGNNEGLIGTFIVGKDDTIQHCLTLNAGHSSVVRDVLPIVVMSQSLVLSCGEDASICLWNRDNTSEGNCSSNNSNSSSLGKSLPTKRRKIKYQPY